MWCIFSECAIIALFDDEVPLEMKLRISNKLMNESNTKRNTDELDENFTDEFYDNNRCKIEKIAKLLDEESDYFVTIQSEKLFERYDLNTEFLEIRPSERMRNVSYLNALIVVNDCAEKS